MDRLTPQEWNALAPEIQKQREAEMPWEIFAEKNKAEQERLTNLNIEKDRKLKAALQQAEELDKRIKALEASGASAGQIKNLENIREQYLADLEKDPLNANARLALTQAGMLISNYRKSDAVKKTALRKLRKDFPKDFDKYGEDLEDMLDNVQNPENITLESVVIMFNSLRGKTIDDQIKEAREEGRKKALEDAGIVAVDTGGSSGSGSGSGSSLIKEQQEEMTRMGLEDTDYKEILRGRQEKDRLEGRTPRTLINPKH